MRSAWFALAALAASACATTSQPASGPTAFVPVCNPCPMPCKPEPGCGKPKVVAAPTPPPPPPPPPPAPKEPAAAPAFSPAAGTFDGKQQVTLSSSTPGAVIHYTTDGSMPTESSPVYTGPITVDKNTTVKAIAVAPDVPASQVASADYSITPPPPPPPPSRVTVGKEKLELNEKVYFETGKADIKPASYGLLDEVAAALKSHDEIKKVVVEGHTDNAGKAKMNKTLSQKRAAAVRAYLVKQGVDGSRLEAKGFGSERPVESNKTAKGREANRRVDFVIAK